MNLLNNQLKNKLNLNLSIDCADKIKDIISRVDSNYNEFVVNKAAEIEDLVNDIKGNNILDENLHDLNEYFMGLTNE